ncbi:Uncharacterised protein [Mycobacterium tuberculosis]|nr:Uncharacterised protein [Mycobacterium tuberculosis]
MLIHLPQAFSDILQHGLVLQTLRPLVGLHLLLFKLLRFGVQFLHRLFHLVQRFRNGPALLQSFLQPVQTILQRFLAIGSQLLRDVRLQLLHLLLLLVYPLSLLLPLSHHLVHRTGHSNHNGHQNHAPRRDPQPSPKQWAKLPFRHLRRVRFRVTNRTFALHAHNRRILAQIFQSGAHRIIPAGGIHRFCGGLRPHSAQQEHVNGACHHP